MMIPEARPGQLRPMKNNPYPQNYILKFKLYFGDSFPFSLIPAVDLNSVRVSKYLG